MSITNFWKNETNEEPKSNPQWGVGSEVAYGEDILCAKCGGKTRLIMGFCEWNTESWECLDESCKACMECRIIYETQGKNQELTPVKCVLEKIW